MENDARFRKGIVLQIRFKAFPDERRFLTPPIQPLKNQSFGNKVKSLNSSAISTDTIVLVVTPELRPQYWPPLLEFRSVAYFLEPFIHLLACPAKSLGTGLTMQCPMTTSTLTPIGGTRREGFGL